MPSFTRIASLSGALALAAAPPRRSCCRRSASRGRRRHRRLARLRRARHPDPAYDWVTRVPEQQSGCEVRVKTANTSDEMVALMNEGGSTWSPPRATRATPGRRQARPGNQPRPDPELEHDRRAAAECALAQVDGKHYGVPYQWGSNVDVQHRSVQGAARELERGVRGSTLPCG